MNAKYPSLPYIAPFAAFLGFLAMGQAPPAGIEVLYPIRVVVVTAIIILFSRSVLDFRVRNALGSVLLGVAVFVIWVGPDVLWPAYRSHWLFTNSITGEARSTATESLKSNLLFIVFRTAGGILRVPVLAEIFWRGLPSGWIIGHQDFPPAPV